MVNVVQGSKGKGHTRTDHEGAGGGRLELQLYSLSKFGARWGWVKNAITPPPILPLEKTRYAFVQETGKDRGLVVERSS